MTEHSLARPSRALLAGLCFCAGLASAAELSPEERLQAVRHSLTQQSLQGATQVQTTSWIDAQGALREASSFRTGMQVRGIRVLAYSRDAQGQPQAQLQLQPPQDLVKPQAGPAQAAGVKTAAAQAPCPPQDSLRHVVGLQVQPRGRWPIDEEHLRIDAAQVLSDAWRDAANDAAWRLLQLPAAAAPHSSLSLYERLLTGGVVHDAPLAWRLQLDMEQLPSPAPVLHLPWASTSSRLRLTLALHAPGQSPPLWQQVLEMPLQAQERTLSAPRLKPVSREQLRALVQTWARTVSERLACEPVQAQVMHTQADRLQIDQGSLAGVRLGDEWLVSDRRRWPSRMLESESKQSLVLARVEQVSQTRAQLQVLAGPSSAVRPNWQAWPMDKP